MINILKWHWNFNNNNNKMLLQLINNKINFYYQIINVKFIIWINYIQMLLKHFKLLELEKIIFNKNYNNNQMNNDLMKLLDNLKIQKIGIIINIFIQKYYYEINLYEIKI